MRTEFTGRRVVVAGIATSGAAVADALLDRGANVVVVDGRDGPAERETAGRLAARGAVVRLGDAETPVEADLVITSPGWRPTQPLLAAALSAGVEVIGEPELAWRLRPRERSASGQPWVAVTGTNGKTTTVGMVESILRAAGHRTVAAGNVGLPLISAVLADPPYDVLAVELSSFQLHWSTTMAPDAAVVLNIAEDHLDWHGSFDAYARDKAAIWRAGGCGAYNADDPVVSELAQHHLDDPHPFTLSAPEPGGFGIVDGTLVDAMAGWAPDFEPEPPNRGVGGVPLVEIADLAVSGNHNIANALAAAAVSRVFGLNGDVTVPWTAVGEGLRAYRPGRHRNELIVTVGGVDYVDDSKATNPHAADASLGAYESVVWVAGGLFKGADVAPLVARHASRLRGVVAIGVEPAPLVDALRRHAPNVPVVEVVARDTGVMDQAVIAARELAQPGDTVLLAPAAASMDQFRDYAERGDRFAAAARAIAGERS